MKREADGLLKQVGVNVKDINAEVSTLSGGQRQSIVVGRAVYWGGRIINDLDIENLIAIREGLAEVTMGVHPYTYGYLTVQGLCEHLLNNKPLPNGWIDPRSERVDKSNISEMFERETNWVLMRNWYKKYIDDNFADLNAVAQPWDVYKKIDMEY